MKVISPILLKIGCHGNVPWGIGKAGLDWQHSCKYLPFGEKKSWKSVEFKKEKEITEGKIYSPVGKFAERAKLFN